MKPKLPLRIASGLLLLHLIFHSIGNSTWKQTDDPIKRNVISQMTDHKFPFMGTTRAMADYFNGFGYIISIALAFLSLLLWILSNSSKESLRLTFKILVLITVALFVWAIDEFVFFFPFAGCITLLAALFSCIATLQLRQHQ